MLLMLLLLQLLLRVLLLLVQSRVMDAALLRLLRTLRLYAPWHISISLLGVRLSVCVCVNVSVCLSVCACACFCGAVLFVVNVP